MTTITEPGMHYDMPAEDYHADPVGGSLSSTMARLIMEPAGPAKLRYRMRHPQPHMKHFDIGTAAHTLALGTGPAIARIPDELLSKSGSTGTTAAREFIAQARDEGKIPLKSVEADEVEAMAESLAAHPDAVEALTGRAEVSMFARDELTGTWLRGRVDVLTERGIGDLKTTTDADPRHFGRRTAAELGYYQQAAWYLDLAKANGHPAREFRFVLIEKKPPYLVSVATLDDDYLALGRARNRAAIDLYAECVASDTWPAYTGTQTVGPPRWLTDQHEDELAIGIADELAAYAASLKEKTS